MSLLFSVLGIGLLLGMRHATDADHVIAVTTIVSKQRKIHSSTLIGALWGIGHSATVTLVAIPIIIFSFVVPPRLGLGLEFTVGMMLVFLGFLNLSGITEKITNKFTPIIHTHVHTHGEKDKHNHLHTHMLTSIQENFHHLGIFQTLRPVFIGLVHGLAGSAAIALLILSTIHNPTLATIYLLIFHIGVIAGMMIITTFLGVSVAVIKRESESMHKYLVVFSGILSLLFGLFVMYQTGIHDGLFSNQLHWTPQ